MGEPVALRAVSGIAWLWIAFSSALGMPRLAWSITFLSGKEKLYLVQAGAHKGNTSPVPPESYIAQGYVGMARVTMTCNGKLG